jgi:hypothetical protein
VAWFGSTAGSTLSFGCHNLKTAVQIAQQFLELPEVRLAEPLPIVTDRKWHPVAAEPAVCMGSVCAAWALYLTQSNAQDGSSF